MPPPRRGEETIQFPSAARSDDCGKGMADEFLQIFSEACDIERKIGIKGRDREGDPPLKSGAEFFWSYIPWINGGVAS